MRYLNCWDNKNFWGAKSGPLTHASSVNKKFQEEDITDVEDEEENVDEDVKTESEEEFEGGEIEGLFL